MECPVCRADVADDALKCAGCGTELTSDAAETQGEPNMELVCIEEVRDPSRCAVLASLLGAEGIPVALHNAVGPMLRGISDGPFTWDATFGGVRLMVPRSFEQAARELVEAQVPVPAGDDEGPPGA